MPVDGEPMMVTRVHEGRSSHIEPPLDSDWDGLTQLRWKAAVVEHETSLRIRVSDGGYSREILGRWQTVRGMYSIQVGWSTHFPLDFHQAWAFLNGVGAGCYEGRREEEESS